MQKLYLLYPMECCSGWSANAIVTSYKYTDTLQVYSIQTTSPGAKNTSPGIQIQVQTLKYKSRHANTSPDAQIQVHTTNTSPDTQIQVQTPKIQVHTTKIQVQAPKIQV